MTVVWVASSENGTGGEPASTAGKGEPVMSRSSSGAMSVDERINAALRGGDVDYAPLSQLFWRWGPTANERFDWADDEARLEFVVGELGLDEVLLVRLFGVHLEPPKRSWVEQVPGEELPRLHSAVETPAMKMSAVEEMYTTIKQP